MRYCQSRNYNISSSWWWDSYSNQQLYFLQFSCGKTREISKFLKTSSAPLGNTRNLNKKIWYWKFKKFWWYSYIEMHPWYQIYPCTCLTWFSFCLFIFYDLIIEEVIEELLLMPTKRSHILKQTCSFQLFKYVWPYSGH